MMNRKKLLLTLSMILGLNTTTLMAELTQIELDATLSIVTNFILDDGIIHNGTTYKTVTSPYTGRVWLDRNLGASQVCTSFDDPLCYGDYYQWGRDHDGHQESNSSTTATLAVNNIGHGDFIISGDDWTSSDSNGSLRAANWSNADGSSVCPTGFRVPTVAELKAETLDNGVSNRATAFANFLKLPSAGLRDKTLGDMIFEGDRGALWASSVDGSDSFSVYSSIVSAGSNAINRANGRSVRCIKNTTPADIVPPVITITGAIVLHVFLNDTYSDEGATAVDDVDGNLTVTTADTVDTSTLGDYNITYTATDSAGNVDTAVRTVSVLNSVTHYGVSYGEITSPYTGKIWLDRNLGASQACASLDDALCYGDYYQWGRAHDGHQVSNSSTTTTLALNGNSAGSSFVTPTSDPFDWTSADTNGSLRSAKWSSVDGSSVCPVGFRVPTRAEYEAELLNAGSAEITDNIGAFDSFLKIPSAGFRHESVGDVYAESEISYLWTTSLFVPWGYSIYFGVDIAIWENAALAKGYNLRCIKD